MKESDEREARSVLEPGGDKESEIHPPPERPALHRDMTKPGVLETGLADLDRSECAHTCSKHYVGGTCNGSFPLR